MCNGHSVASGLHGIVQTTRSLGKLFYHQILEPLQYPRKVAAKVLSSGFKK
jgi:hypothetical protein